MNEVQKVSKEELEELARAIILELNMRSDPKYTQSGEGDMIFKTKNSESAYSIKDFQQGKQIGCFEGEKVSASKASTQWDIRFPRYGRRASFGQGTGRRIEAEIDEPEIFSAPMPALNLSETGDATDNSSYRLETVSRIKADGISTEQLSEAFCRDARRYDSAFERF